MSDLIEQFCKVYPRLYHMAEGDSWSSISKHGLLSTTALLDLFEVQGPQRDTLETQWRPRSVTISHPVHGRAVIRDQHPMRPEALRSVLVDTTPEEWYEFLNRRVFMWVNEDRLARMLRSPSYRNQRHDVLTIDSRELLHTHSQSVTVCPINSGFAQFHQGKRSPSTFQTLAERHATDGLRGLAELTVDYAVRDIRQLVISVESRRSASQANPILRRR